MMKNKVQNSPYTVITSGNASGPAGLTSATINGYINGEPVGTFYLREYLGIRDIGALSNSLTIVNDVNDNFNLIRVGRCATH